MIRLAGVLLAVCMLVPATAGTSAARPRIALAAFPSHLDLAGSAKATIRLTNSGSRSVVVDVRRAGFALDLRGRPRIVRRGGARAADGWLSFHPSRVALRPGSSSTLTVTSKVPGRVEPGDHDALVLLTTRPRQTAALAVRMRIGVVVVVRAPGRIVRRLELRQLRVRRAGRPRMLELLVVNRGNVTERIGRGRAVVTLTQRGAAPTRLRPLPRELRPRTRGLVQVPYRGRLRGWVTARVRVSSGVGVISGAYRIHL